MKYDRFIQQNVHFSSCETSLTMLKFFGFFVKFRLEMLSISVPFYRILLKFSAGNFKVFFNFRHSKCGKIDSVCFSWPFNTYCEKGNSFGKHSLGFISFRTSKILLRKLWTKKVHRDIKCQVSLDHIV